MQPIGTLIQQPRRALRSETERGSLLTYFMEVINAERRGTKWRQVKIGYVAKKVEGIRTADLYYMKSIMADKIKRGESASAWFHWALKTQHEKEPSTVNSR